MTTLTDPTTNQTNSFNGLVTEFLVMLETSNRSQHTRSTYTSDLYAYITFCQRVGESGISTAESVNTLRSYFATLTHLAPATRAHKQAALASFFRWAYKNDLLEANPMEKIERVKLQAASPRGVGRKLVEAVLAVIPTAKVRDRLLFHLIFETGLRVGEALAIYIEDIDLTLDDEHIVVTGKGNKRRTVLLDDTHLVQQIRNYLKRTGYRNGPLFRAEKNNQGGPLRYQTVQASWSHYAAQAGVSCTLHQLRHTHATELVNAGVSLTTIRKRLGHQNLQTTLRYAEQSDQVADAELRAWRRQRQQTG